MTPRLLRSSSRCLRSPQLPAETLEACLAVAFENLAAGTIPQSVLDALTAQLAAADEVPEAPGQDGDDASELGELVGLLMAAAPINVDLTVASNGLLTDNAPTSPATVVLDTTGEPPVPAASVPPLPQAPVGQTPVMTADVPSAPLPVGSEDAAMTAAGKPELPVDADQPREVLEASSQKAAASTPVESKVADAVSLPSAPAAAVTVAATSPDRSIRPRTSRPLLRPPRPRPISPRKKASKSCARRMRRPSHRRRFLRPRRLHRGSCGS